MVAITRLAQQDDVDDEDRTSIMIRVDDVLRLFAARLSVHGTRPDRYDVVPAAAAAVRAS